MKTLNKNKKYILDLSKLEVGDIILESGYKLHSKAIQYSTGSHYSHAKIYWINGSIIEASLKGVHSDNPSRTLYKSKDDVKVLRYKNLTEDNKNSITEYLREQIGSKYSTTEAISVLLSDLRKNDESKQFCSRLIAQAYTQAGIPIYDEPDYCSPKDIENSHLLCIIPDCLIEATDIQIKFAESEPEFLNKQTEATNYIIYECEKIAGIEFKNLNHIIQFLIVNNQFDKNFSKILEDSGYLNLIDIEIKNNPYRYDINEFMKKCNSPNSINIIHELNSQIEIFNRHLKYLDNLYEINLRYELKYIELLIELYERLTSIHKRSIDIFKSELPS